MNSYHGLQLTKDKYVERMRAHISADNLIRGTGWDGVKGCAVGCTLERYKHDAYPAELGLPTWLAYLSDVIFEGCSVDYSKTFPLRLLESIPVGVDVSDVWRPLAIMRHERQLERNCAIDCRDALQQVIDYLKNPSESARLAAESAAWAVADSVAESAAWSARSAAAAAKSVAWAASEAAWSASEAAWSEAAWSKAAQAEYKIEGENLIKLLSECK